MYFHYIAAQHDGKVTEGDIDASTANDVLAILANRGMRPISLKVAKASSAGLGKRIFGQKITVDDKVFLTKYLALMLRVGTDLFKAIDILIDDFEKVAVKALLLEIRSNLEKGQPFYLTFSKYPRYFSSAFVNLIKAGESSGNLENVFNELSVSLQKEQELRRKIKAAITYPLILLVAASLMLMFLIMFALPKISSVFLSSSVQPPLFSRIVFAMGNFASSHIASILITIGLSIVSCWLALTRSIHLRRLVRRLLMKTPVIKTILRQIAFQRFATTLASLLKAGLPILDSLEITADAVGYDELRLSLLRIAREGIAKGVGIGEAFRRESIFPRVIANLMEISERAGHIEDALMTLSTFYESEIDSSIKVLLSFLEPILLFGIGIVIGSIALAIIVPIYQLIGNFS